jgi:hypothetical protein
MVAWSRLLGGGVRDPLVGGHLLIGYAFGFGLATVLFVSRLLGEQSGALDRGLVLDSFLGARHMSSVFLGDVLEGVFYLTDSPFATFPAPRDVSAAVDPGGRCPYCH